MKIKEVVRNRATTFQDDDVHNDITDILSRQPSNGGSGTLDFSLSRVHTLMYPVNRLDLFESLSLGMNTSMDSLYADNTIFTAYDIQGRKRNDLLGSITGAVIGGGDNYGMNMNTVANIMMPRSNTDVDEHKHEFVTAQESLMSRGNESIGNAIGSGLSTMVAEVFDNITKGYFADEGEAIGTPTRSTYKGAEHRVKTYSWKISPRNINDLMAIIDIYKTFTFYSYGSGRSSKSVVNGANYLIKQYEDMLKSGKTGVNDVTLTGSQILETFKYVKVMTNPTLWYIRNYEPGLSQFKNTSVFGPANIINVKINNAPEGKYQGFARTPNYSSSFELEVTFREAISHTRDTIGNFL